MDLVFNFISVYYIVEFVFKHKSNSCETLANSSKWDLSHTFTIEHKSDRTEQWVIPDIDKSMN